ncbi:Exodeoxyribonuclease 7 large subunit [bioreactor metagenome]|uniref:Exodeoxyribonuclease 7 large subunit n=1 Tax=bioreactor metagenome TaxID=1076179 RepID=A0A644YTQ7_9ZZZZ
MYSKYLEEDIQVVKKIKYCFKDETLSPNYIKSIYNNNPIIIETVCIRLKGIVECGNMSKGKKYHFNLCIKDEITNEKINTWIPNTLACQLIDGNIYEFKGFLNRKLDGDLLNMKVTFVVNEILNKSEYKAISLANQNNATRLRDLKNKCMHKTYNDVRQILSDIIESENRNPSIAIITGLNSIILSDIYNEIRHSELYDFEEIRVNLGNKDDVINKIKTLEHFSYDIVVLARGGGDSNNLTIFNDLDIVESIVNLNKPFITAIGHFEDSSIVQNFADRAFTTPTSFGAWLNNESIKFLKVKEKNRVLKEAQSTINDYVGEIESLKIGKQKADKLIESLSEKLEQMQNIEQNNSVQNFDTKNLFKNLILAVIFICLSICLGKILGLI